jgi:hypothetical protein
MPSKNNSSVIVAGDVTIDWNLARSQVSQEGSVWNVEDCTRAFPQAGGAALLGKLIDTVANGLGAERPEVSYPQSKRKIQPGDPAYHHSYAMWSLHKYGEGPSEAKEKAAWRVERFLGHDRCAQEPSEGIDDVSEPPLLLVLDDSNLGFRDQESRWGKLLKRRKQAGWVLVKMSQPVSRGPLWEHLQRHCSEKLIVVMTVNDLRLTEVQISREISWERTAQDLAWELIHNPSVNALSRCAHVIVSFDAAGAFLLSRSNRPDVRSTCRLFFDPRYMEGMWEREHRGHMIGHTVALTAGIARHLLLNPSEPDIERGIQSGLAGLRKLHLDGYGQRGSTVSEAQLDFPFETISLELESENKVFAEADVEDPVRFLKQPTTEDMTGGFWTMLSDRYVGNLHQVAEKIVVEGPEAVLTDVPLGRFGNLLTVDRHEIESFRSIGSLIGQYCQLSRPKRPLSIAVFGAPGAGKSFGIVEVSKSLLPGQIQVLEFNVSQLASPADILDALHQVRDVGLSGMIPLVFWDEFDTSLQGQALGWLRYFLAPMQDGKFQQGQISHPVGRAIFVFAGGTSETMEAFDRGSNDREFKNVKGPDFVSRLKGFVNILGPNRKRGGDDPYFVIRRAILLRSILSRDAPQLLHNEGKTQRLLIDNGVLRAMLNTDQYKHGVRSMESIVVMSSLAGRRVFERSALPAESQLNLHVDSADFLALMQQMNLNGEFLEQLAAAAHEVFFDDLRKKGYRYGATTDDSRKTHSSLKSYSELPEDEREQNRGNVRDIANKLALAGYIMMPARSNDPPLNFPGPDLEHLAELEHDRWMRLKLEAGWKWAASTDKSRRLHQALLPWQVLDPNEKEKRYGEYASAVGDKRLPEAEKEKDRVFVRKIPIILARAGYTVMKSNRPGVQKASASRSSESKAGRSAKR